MKMFKRTGTWLRAAQRRLLRTPAAMNRHWMCEALEERTLLATFGGHEYLLTTAAMTRDLAQIQAVSFGGNLATIDSQAENDFLRDAFGDGSFFIGLNDASVEGTFRWANGQAPSFTSWASGEPNNFENREDAVVINGVSGFWFDWDGNFPGFGIIEIDTPGRLASSTYRLSSPSLSWEEARAEAASLGGYLATIETAVENDFLTSLFDDTRYFIGLSDARSEGNFEWINGQTVNFTRWLTGEPNNFGLTEDRAVIDASDGVWLDWNGDAPGQGIIEIPDDLTFQFRNHTYLLTSPNLTWDQARAEAVSRGGRLVTIQSAAENKFLTEAFDDQPYFIGLSDVQTEGTFRWINGQTLRFSRWLAGEPNNFQGIEDHAVIDTTDGFWLDWNGNFPGRGIIEIGDAVQATGAGVIAEYFDNIDLTNRVITRTDATIDFDWGVGSPVSGVAPDTFSVRWLGMIEPRFTETYTFRTYSNDGIRLWVNGQLIVDQWNDHGPTFHTGTIALEAGELYDIRVEYYDNGGAALAQLAWSSASQPLEVVPTTQLYEPYGVISLETSVVNVNEAAGNAIINISRDLGAFGTLTVDYRTVDGTAISGVHFVAQAGRITFSEEERQKSIVVPILNNSLRDGSKQFTLTIDNVLGGGTLLAPRTATVTIVDDETIFPDFPNFNNSTGLQRNGTATINGSALQLTQGTNYEAGSAFFTSFFPLNGQTSFRTDFSFQIVGGSTGGDGFTFVLHNSPSGATAVGSSGQGLGYAGIANSVAVEFDTYRNTDEVSANHVSLLVNGNVSVPLATASPGLDLNGGGVAYAWIDYNGNTNLLTVCISSTNVKPTQPRLSATLDIAAILGNQLFVGFTASTGDNVNSHRILSWRYNDGVPPAPPPPDTGSQLVTETIATGFLQPTAVDWSDGGRNMLVAEQRGVVRVVRDGVLLTTPFIDIRNQVNGIRDRGLMDIAVHPNFAANPYVYLLFTYDPPETANFTGLAGPDGNGNRAGRLIRVTANAAANYTTAVVASEFILLGRNSTWANFNGFVNSTTDFNEPPAGILSDGTNRQDFIASDSDSHTIGGLNFAADGKLFVSIGDGTSYNQVDPRTVRVQDIDNLSGKVLRIDPISGQGVSDNPFYNGNPDANRSKVYQYGLRNPFRITSHPTSGRAFIGDVGWGTWEEVNSAGPGANFGWPYYEGGNRTNNRTGGYQNLPAAQAFYNSGQTATPSIFALNHATDGINAIVLGDFYTGNSYPATYQGDLFLNDLGQGIVRNISFDAAGNISSVETFATGAVVVVQISSGPDGKLYFVDLDDGRVGRWEFV